MILPLHHEVSQKYKNKLSGVSLSTPNFAC
jgi:hypothetical protein